MGSDTYQALRAIGADPHLWIGASALFLGFALGQVFRALLPPRIRSARSMRTRSRRATTEAYLTFVAIDDAGAPRAIPQLLLESPDDHRRHAEAAARRADRLRAAGRAP